jgi:hypothetical protein
LRGSAHPPYAEPLKPNDDSLTVAAPAGGAAPS